MPTVDIDVPLTPIRDLLYKGFGLFTLLRTYKETSTPVNFSEAVYTALRVDGPGVIGHTPIAIGKSVWVDHRSCLSAGLIILITKSPDTVMV
ncbi:hypothetical protein BBP40_007977 [Aspergillus hancockii]|nr:hypothetical protein BBP40_007977 [Aspergillus hancockii]